MAQRIIKTISFQKHNLLKNTMPIILLLLLFTSLNSFANSTKPADKTNNETVCPIVLFIEPLAAICLDPSVSAFPLNVTIQGSDGSGFGVWSGPGIIDPINGIFDPFDSLVIIGNNIVTYTFVENSCVIAETTTIVIHTPPDASFNMDSPICSNEFSNLIATNSTGDIYDWDFNGGLVISGENEGPYEISWPIAGIYTVSLLLEDQNGCTSFESQTIDVKKPLDLPVIDCNSTTSEIVFNWGNVPGATDHEVLLINGPAGTEGLNLYSVSNLIPGGDSVTIQVSAVGPLPCGNSTTVKTCYTLDCPSLTINIQAVEDICLYPNTNSVELVGNLVNYDPPGVWSGNGIIDPVNGIFDPNHPSVNNGSNTIYITFSEEICLFMDSIVINVFDLPTVNAGITDEISCANPEISLTGNAWGFNLAYNWSGQELFQVLTHLILLLIIRGIII